jgi:hypothetical protein
MVGASRVNLDTRKKSGLFIVISHYGDSFLQTFETGDTESKRVKISSFEQGKN